jgi:hypothetical protein
MNTTILKISKGCKNKIIKYSSDNFSQALNKAFQDSMNLPISYKNNTND